MQHISQQKSIHEKMKGTMGWKGAEVEGETQRKHIKDFNDSFVWLLNERKRNKDPG